MIEYVKPNRLHARRWFAALALGCVSLAANAQGEIPFNTPKNSIEYKAAGNTYTWQPVTGETPRPAQPYRPDLSGGTVSNVEPKAKWTPALPYDHKGGSGAKMNFSAVASKAAVAGAAAKEFAKGAITCGVKPSHPLVVSAVIAGCMGGPFLVAAAIDWGWHQLVVDDQGNLSAVYTDNTFTDSLGKIYTFAGGAAGYSPESFYTLEAWCRASAALFKSQKVGPGVYNGVIQPNKCKIDTFTISPQTSTATDCPVGWKTNGFQCFAPSEVPFHTTPIDQALEEKITNSPWSMVSAKIMAGVMTAGHGLFTDGTSGTITGPSTVPLGTSTDSWPVNVISGTTTEAPVGHTGSTDPATKTATTTKEAQNTYSGNTQTVTQKGTTTTSVTNNITNNTSTSVTTNITQSDEAPKEPEKDFCEKNPDALACAEADTPEQDVPRDKITISYEYADIFGNGSCPADAYLNTRAQSLKVWDWQNTCEKVQDYFRPVLIACCAFAAFLIISAGVKE